LLLFGRVPLLGCNGFSGGDFGWALACGRGVFCGWGGLLLGCCLSAVSCWLALYWWFLLYFEVACFGVLRFLLFGLFFWFFCWVVVAGCSVFVLVFFVGLVCCGGLCSGCFGVVVRGFPVAGCVVCCC